MAKKRKNIYKLFNAEQLADVVDAMGQYNSVYFTDEDLTDMDDDEIEDVDFNFSVYKGTIFNEDFGVLIIGNVAGGSTMAKDIVLLSDGEPYNREKRIKGMVQFIQEYLDTVVERCDVFVELKNY